MSATITYWYLEQVDFDSNTSKFYEVAHIYGSTGDNLDLTVSRWGRIGSTGQMKADPNGSVRLAQEQVHKKEAKGYTRVRSCTADLKGNVGLDLLSRRALIHDKHAYLAELDRLLVAGGHNGMVPTTAGVPTSININDVLTDADDPKNDPVDTGVFGSDPGKDEIAAEHLALGLLVDRAQRLVPAVAQNPLEHAVAVAEVREQASKYRNELQALQSHLSVLDALLTEGIAR